MKCTTTFADSQLVDWRKLDFSLPRFWSSPKLLPAKSIIRTVLKQPTNSDVFEICSKFGLKLVERELLRLHQSQQIPEKIHQKDLYLLKIFKKTLQEIQKEYKKELPPPLAA